MDPRWEEMKVALNKLHQDLEQFWAQPDVKACSAPDLIAKFLETIDSTLPEMERLGFFAYNCSNHLDWSGICQVFEYLIAENLDEGDTYFRWTFIGRGYLKDIENHSLEERVRVAADLESIFERAAEDSDSFWDKVRAYFYYDHPLKAEQPQLYLLKSKEWFERAIASEEFNECDHHDLQALGHVFFELGDFKTALLWYEKYAAVEDLCGDACFLDRTLTEKRLVECRKRSTDVDGQGRTLL